MPDLEVRDVSVRYGGVAAVRAVSLSVPEGTCVAIIGPNGAGKSSLLSALTGTVQASAGRVTFGGEDLLGRAPEQIVRSGLSLVPERRRIFGSMTVEENLRVALATRRDGDAAWSEIEGHLTMFPALGRYRHARAGHLSGGEQQQLAIVRALVTKPELLMLDEPSLGLAPIVVDQVFQLLADLSKERLTILLVEQNAARAIELADYTYVLSDGGVRAHGDRIQMEATRDEIMSAYLGVTPPGAAS